MTQVNISFDNGKYNCSIGGTDRMNDLIRDIALECSVEYVASPVWTFSDAELKKFAELIIRECARVVQNADLEDVDGGDSAVLRAASHQIKKHFGVE